MRASIISGISSLVTTATRYTGLQNFSSSASIASATNAQQVMPQAGTVVTCRFKLTAAPGVGNSWTFTLFKNGSTTGQLVTISGANTTGDFSPNTTYIAGDLLQFQITLTGTPAASGLSYGVVLDQDGCPCLSGSNSSNLNNAASRFFGLHAGAIMTAAPSPGGSVVPTAGVFSNAYVRLSGASGAGTSYTLTLYKNGSPTSLAVTLSNVATNNNTVNTVSVAAGDTVYWEASISGTPTARICSVSCLFTPTTDGESILTYTSSGVAAQSLNTTATRYQGFGSEVAWNATEANKSSLAPQDIALRNLYVLASAPAGAGRSYTFTARKTNADTLLVTSISGDSQVNNQDTSNQIIMLADSVISFKSVPAGTPTQVALSFGIVAFTPPTNECVGDLLDTNVFAGTLVGENVCSGDIADVNTFSGTLVGENVSVGDLLDTNMFSGTLVGENVLSGDLLDETTLSGTLTGENTLVGDLTDENLFLGLLTQEQLLIGNLTDTNTFLGTLTVIVPVQLINTYRYIVNNVLPPYRVQNKLQYITNAQFTYRVQNMARYIIRSLFKFRTPE